MIDVMCSHRFNSKVNEAGDLGCGAHYSRGILSRTDARLRGHDRRRGRLDVQSRIGYPEKLTLTYVGAGMTDPDETSLAVDKKYLVCYYG